MALPLREMALPLPQSATKMKTITLWNEINVIQKSQIKKFQHLLFEFIDLAISGVLNHQHSLLHSHSCVYTPAFTLPQSRSSVHAPAFTFLHSHSCIYSTAFTLPHLHSRIHTPAFTVQHSQSRNLSCTLKLSYMHIKENQHLHSLTHLLTHLLTHSHTLTCNSTTDMHISATASFIMISLIQSHKMTIKLLSLDIYHLPL